MRLSSALLFYFLIQFVACFIWSAGASPPWHTASPSLSPAIFLANQTEFWSCFTGCDVANHSVALAERLVMAEGRVFFRFACSAALLLLPENFLSREDRE